MKKQGWQQPKVGKLFEIMRKYMENINSKGRAKRK